MTNIVRSAVATLLLGACSSGPNGTGADAGIQGTVFGAALVGLFPVDMYSTVTAQFYDAPTAPPDRTLEMKMQQGGCRLLTEVVCSPACAAGTYCSTSKTCVANPNGVGVGTLHVAGLAGMSLEIDPTPPKNTYSSNTLTMPYPPCAEGGDITLQSDKFTVGIKCITALVVTSPLPIPVTKGQAMHVAWAPPGQAGISRVEIELEISHHGGYKGQINCDVADTGTFDIPAPLVTALVDLGVAGYPSVKVTRSSSKAPPSEPGAKLSMPSMLDVAVDVAGFISCGGPTSPPCPSGTNCDSTYMLCK